MGFRDADGSFVGLAKDTFELSNFMSGFYCFCRILNVWIIVGCL
jgi:hypothetical protein